MPGSRVTFNPAAWLAAVALLLATGLPVVAEEQPAGGEWAFGGEIYLWGATIDGALSAGDKFEFEFKDLLENLNIAFMGRLEARKQKWTLFADALYLNTEANHNGTAHIIHHPVEASADVQLKNFTSTLGGSYAVLETDSTVLDAVAGARYLWVDFDFDFDLGNKISKSASVGGQVWDGVVGIRGNTQLNDKWYLTYYGDVGTGQSDLTWQAMAAINYRFKKVDAVFGYRYLRWEFDEGENLGKDFDNIYVSGPFAGVKFGF